MKKQLVAAKEIPGDRSERHDGQFPRSWLQEDLRR